MSPDIMERTLLSFERLMSLSALSATINASDVPGIVIEVGVYRGGSAMFLALENLDREIHVFDTFAGIPGDPWELDGHKRGDFVADYEDVAEFLKDCHNIKIYRGVFPATLPKGIGPVALAHIDVDMEQSARESIIALWPKLSPGGYLVFDDYGAEGCRGVKRAVDEMFGERVVRGPECQAWVQKVFLDIRGEE